MGRMYSCAGSLATITTAQDLITLTMATNVAAWIHEIEITSDLTSDERNVIVLHSPSAAGSGGSAGTEVALEAGMPAADGAVVFGNTTQSTPAGIKRQTAWSCLVPFHYLPTPESRILVPGGGIFVVELGESITSTTVQCNIVWEELG